MTIYMRTAHAKHLKVGLIFSRLKITSNLIRASVKIYMSLAEEKTQHLLYWFPSQNGLVCQRSLNNSQSKHSKISDALYFLSNSQELVQL